MEKLISAFRCLQCFIFLAAFFAAAPLLQAAGKISDEDRCEYPVWCVKSAEKNYERIAYALVSKVFGTQVWVVRPDLPQNKLMLTSKSWNRHPYWSWDGTKLAFAGGDANGVQQLWIMDDDGGGTKQLTDTAEDKLYPVLSPQYNRIAYFSVVKEQATVNIMDLDKNNEVKVIARCGNITPNTVLSPAAWSPDMKYLAYVKLDSEFKNENVYVIDINSREERQLTKTGYIGSGLAWSPDGNSVLFPAPSVNSRNFSLFKCDVNTGELSELIPLVTPLGAAFSPSGKKICYVKNYQIWSADADGRNQRQVTVPEVVVDLKAWEVRKKQNMAALLKLKGFVGRRVWLRKNIWTSAGQKLNKLTECELSNVRNKIMLPGKEVVTDKASFTIEIELKIEGKKFFVVYLNEIDGYLEDFSRFFFFEDPVKTRNWPSSVWEAIKSRDVLIGMTPEQVLLSLGEPSEMLSNPSSRNEIWDYKFIGTISFENGRVKEFKPVMTIKYTGGGAK